MYYMEMLRQLPDAKRKQQDPAAVLEIYKPLTAPEARMVAWQLQSCGRYPDAKKFFIMALEIPLTDKDALWYSHCQQVFLSRDEWKDNFRMNALNDLARCLAAMNQPEEAQKYLDELAKLQKKTKRGNDSHMYLAGSVDSAAGATSRPTETSILEEEKISANDPQYWLKRATYYAGAGDAQKQEEACKKVLELAKPVPKMFGKHSMDTRSAGLMLYVQLLKQSNRAKEAYALLLAEMKDAGPKTESGIYAGNCMASRDFRDMINPDEPIIWAWMDGLDEWRHGGEQMLRVILASTVNKGTPECGMPGNRPLKGKPNPKLSEYFDRASKMVMNRNPEKAYWLAVSIAIMGYDENAVPLVEYTSK